MPRPQRFYTTGHLVGQPIQEYPKMLKRGAERRTVRNEAEHDAAEDEGWGESGTPAPRRMPDAIVPDMPDFPAGEGDESDDTDEESEDESDDEENSEDAPPSPFVKKAPARRRRRR